MESKPLAGKGILVTRPAERAGALAGLIEQAGGHAYVYPALRIEPPRDAASARARLGALEGYDLAVFVSPTAVERAFALLKGIPAATRAAAVGAATREALERHGVRDVLTPAEGADSEALLALAPLADMTGKRVLIVRGEGGRALLGETLVARGARVDYAECYRRAPPPPPPPPILAALENGRIDAVTVSSAWGLEQLFEALPAGLAHRLRAAPLLVPHERVAEIARRRGATRALVAGPSDREVLARLVAYFKGP